MPVVHKQIAAWKGKSRRGRKGKEGRKRRTQRPGRVIVDAAGAVGDVAHNECVTARVLLQQVRDHICIQEKTLRELKRH